jgi:PAS domain S-box-containing protein
MLEAAPIGVLHADAEGRVTAANPAAAAALGRDLADLAGVDWTTAIHPEDRPLACAARHQALEEGRAAAEARALGDDGRVIHLRIAVLRDGAGHGVFLEDVSDAERARRELSAARAELSRFAREQAELLSLLAHELHEPLRKIAAFTEILRDSTAGALDATALDALERVQRATGRGRALLEGILEFGRIATWPLARAPVELDEVLQGVVAALATRIAEVGATVEIGPLPSVEADAFLLEQLFSHLVRNALESRRPGAAPRVRVIAGAAEGGACSVLVVDDGEGFDPRQAERIFGAFQRLRGRSSRPGNGLGLTVCRRIAERHDGRIEAQGEPDHGATFTVTLPRVRSPA